MAFESFFKAIVLKICDVVLMSNVNCHRGLLCFYCSFV